MMVIKVLVMTIRDDQVLQLGKEDRKNKNQGDQGKCIK
jgi:hypothetical protein